MIITGGADGIGAGLGRAMVKEGAIVVAVAVDRNPEAGANVLADLQQYSPQSSFIEFNLTKHDQIKNVVEQFVE